MPCHSAAISSVVINAEAGWQYSATPHAQTVQQGSRPAVTECGSHNSPEYSTNIGSFGGDTLSAEAAVGGCRCRTAAEPLPAAHLPHPKTQWQWTPLGDAGEL